MVKLEVSVHVKHTQSQHAAKLYSAVGALQPWGLGKLLFFLRSDFLLAGVVGKAWNWQSNQWSTSTGPSSNVDLWSQLVELLERQWEPVVFAKLGSCVQVTEYLRAEELAL